jgi:hypothetical protein
MTTTTTTLDLKQLLNEDVITESTYDWLKPLYEKELNDIKEIHEAAQLRKLNPFFFTNNNDKDDSDNDDDDNGNDNDDNDDDGLSTMTKTTIYNIEDVEGGRDGDGDGDGGITFLTDTNSSGHGNTVWHASIATCRYLKDLVVAITTNKIIEINDNDDDDDDDGTTKQQFHCLELGAGTALPSLFLSQLFTLSNKKKRYYSYYRCKRIS